MTSLAAEEANGKYLKNAALLDGLEGVWT